MSIIIFLFALVASLKAERHVTVAWSSRLYVCMYMSSATLVHPAKAVGRNEMPFGRDTCAVPGNIVLNRGHGKGKFGVERSNPQFTGMPPNANYFGLYYYFLFIIFYIYYYYYRYWCCCCCRLLTGWAKNCTINFIRIDLCKKAKNNQIWYRITLATAFLYISAENYTSQSQTLLTFLACILTWSSNEFKALS